MPDITVLSIFQVTILVLASLLSIIYLIPIILIRRFHTINNVFTANLSIAAFCCSTYWLIYFVLYLFYTNVLSGNTICAILGYFEMMCTLQMPLAIVATSIHRLLSITYSKRSTLSTKRRAIMCISGHWLACIVLPLPRIASFNNPYCDTQKWISVYTFVMYVVVPSIISLVNNILIFQHVRSSSNRIQTVEIGGSQNQRHKISRRDLHLLRHMIIMFVIFVGGWTPLNPPC
ncbi:unnamed protein product [Adineta ricciae]|uniref:G-protein coupled receptors family 1 profile domain-containing protein n=1 Tax=Adineta ricciae TaxID=249248 RepID=A0A813MFB1_ADIRI|nr:unnamed protein product [Adineta ricciae]